VLAKKISLEIVDLSKEKMTHNANNRKMLIKMVFLFIFLTLFTAAKLSAEIIRLKDGQVINGKIISRNDYSIIVKTRYQTRRLSIDEILSIDKEQNDLQQLYILTRDREIIKGFLVEQDSLQVRYKTSTDSESSKTISKLDILKMSNEEIHAVDLEIAVKAGVFYPLNTGGAGLGPSAIYLANIGFSSMIERNWRFSLEAGYTQSKNRNASERYMQIIPITLNSEYRFIVPWRNIEISPRIGIGAALVDYNSGENVELSSRVFAGLAGMKITYPVKPHSFHIGIFADYLMLLDTSGNLRSVMGGIYADFRF
jgi:hypothetical protein